MVQKESFFEILKQRDLFTREKNVVYAENAFLINALLSMCSKSNNPHFVKKVLKLINKHLAGEIKISFINGIIAIEELKAREPA
tara:strand:+ start:1736 stop:1987 length:252 start_codon:yes stop_codon:yes gene_type:complete